MVLVACAVASPTRPGARSHGGAQKSELRHLQDARNIVKPSHREIPEHCRAGDLDETEQLNALPARERLLLDVIRVIAYRT